TWVGMGHLLRSVASTLPRKPSAIVMVSGHWREAQFRVTGHARPELLHDYYGFPQHTYELTYPAPGAPQLAEQIVQTLNDEGLEAAVDPERGFDHGMFIPLKLVFPAADIPVIQLSLRRDLDPAAHLAVGRTSGVMVVQSWLINGCGMSFHNMRAYGDARFSGVSAEFEEWLTGAVERPAQERDELLRNWAKAP